MSESLHTLVAHYGYAFVGLLVGAEGLGIPLPGETALLTAAALAARGHLSIVGVIVAAAAGVAIGGVGGYWIGHTAGQAVVARYGRWVGITSKRLDHTRTFFAQYGARAVVVGRFVPVVRILTGVVAGLTDMPFARFAVYNTIAGVVWSVVFGLLGYEFGRDLPRLEARLGRASLVLAGIAAIAGLGFVLWRKYEREERRK
jgi:membrane protein DedA with SNARE-associated domain